MMEQRARPFARHRPPRYRMPFALLLAAAASAQASDTFRCEDGVISVGTTTTGELLKKCGQPDRTVQLENEFGGAVGERWEYYFDRKTVLVTVIDGRISRIEES